MIYHICTEENWKIALDEGSLTEPSLQLEGFIHNSTLTQISGVINRYYKDVQGLLLLHIDELKLSSPLKYELAPSVNEMFPHVFGPINLDAVVKVTGVDWDETFIE